MHDRVQIGEQLKRRKGKGSEFCKYCGKLETLDHLFFNCRISQLLWVWVRISMRWVVRPISLQHFEEMLGDGEGRITDINEFFILAAVVWALWKSRNDWVFNNNLIKSPKALAYKVVGLLSQWKKMLRPKEVLKMEDTIAKLQEGLKAW